MAVSAKVSNRISGNFKRYRTILTEMLKRDVSEADTVTVINDMLADLCGYDKYYEVTSQYAIRGTYVDLAVKVAEEIRYLIEVKAIGINLRDLHVKQAIDYAANQGIEWVILTNGAVWRIYKVHFGQPIEKILVSEIDLLSSGVKTDAIVECFGNLSKECFSKSTMADLLREKQITNKFTVAAILMTDEVLEDLRKEIRRLSGIRVDLTYLRALMAEDIVKRDLLDGDEALAAAQTLKKMQKSLAKKKNGKIGAEPKPIVAPITDGSGSLPRAIAEDASD